MKSGIYIIKLKKGNYFYVGSSQYLNKRKLHHLSHLKRQKHCNKKLQNVFNKHKDFKFEILEYCQIENLVEKEQYYLDLLKPNLNILKKAFSSIGYKHSKEDLNKITEFNRLISKTEKWRKGVSKSWFKKGHITIMSDENKKKLSERMRMYKPTEEVRKKMSEKAKQRDRSNLDLNKFIIAGIESSKKPVIQKNNITGESFRFDSITNAIAQFNIKQTRHLRTAIDTGKLYKKSYWSFENNS
jgi:group I intron endonuclease